MWKPAQTRQQVFWEKSKLEKDHNGETISMKFRLFCKYLYESFNKQRLYETFREIMGLLKS